MSLGIFSVAISARNNFLVGSIIGRFCRFSIKVFVSHYDGTQIRCTSCDYIHTSRLIRQFEIVYLISGITSDILRQIIPKNRMSERVAKAMSVSMAIVIAVRLKDSKILFDAMKVFFCVITAIQLFKSTQINLLASD